jgi:DNA-binding transcriptional LysR family regulator
MLEIGTMARTGLDELEAAVAVARHRNFRAAAELEMSPTAISSIIRNLEADRSSALQQNYPKRCGHFSGRGVHQPRVGVGHANRQAIDAAQGLAGRPSGTLRINSSVTAGHEILSPLVVEYLRLYPEMKIDLVTDSRLVDIVLQGADAGIRLMDSVPVDMVAVPRGFSLDFSVVGSPAYLARIPEPVTPHELIHHRCARSRWAGGGIYRWEFERGEEKVNIDVPGALTLDEQSLILKAAISGLGLAYIADALTRDAVNAGRLRYVLEEWKPRPVPLCLYYPRNRHTPAALRAFVELIRSS